MLICLLHFDFFCFTYCFQIFFTFLSLVLEETPTMYVAVILVVLLAQSHVRKMQYNINHKIVEYFACNPTLK